MSKREEVKAAATEYATAANAMSFHGLGVTEHSQGTFTVMLKCRFRLINRKHRSQRCWIKPASWIKQCTRSSRYVGSTPSVEAGYLDITNDEVNEIFNEFYGVVTPKEIGYKIPEMFDAALQGNLKALWIIGERCSSNRSEYQESDKSTEQHRTSNCSRSC